MTKAIDIRAVSGVLYGVYKALHEVAGASAPAIMRKAAPDILRSLETSGVDFSGVNSIERLEDMLRKTMVESGCCDDMQFHLDGDKLQTNITNCSFFDLTMALKAKGIPPFGCPFAALTVAVAERNLNKRARIVKLEPTENGGPGDTTLVVELHDKT